MKDHGLEIFEVESLVVSKNFRERIKANAVKSRAESIRDIGLLHFPIVRYGTMEIISGEDRVAAHFLLGRPVHCRVLEGTDDEMRRIRRDENKQRRQTTHERERFLLLELDAAEEETGSRSEARKQTAAALGLEVPTLRKQEQRALERAAKTTETSTERAARMPWESWGHQVDDELRARFWAQEDGFTQARRELTKANRKLERIAEAIPTDRYKKMRAAVNVALQMLSSHTPVALCPACKGVEHIRRACRVCWEAGSVSEAVLEKVPDDLKAMGVAHYMGQLVELEGE